MVVMPRDPDGFEYDFTLWDDVAYCDEDKQAREEFAEYLRETGQVYQ
jgi:hypothetical protein